MAPNLGMSSADGSGSQVHLGPSACRGWHCILRQRAPRKFHHRCIFREDPFTPRAPPLSFVFPAWGDGGPGKNSRPLKKGLNRRRGYRFDSGRDRGTAVWCMRRGDGVIAVCIYAREPSETHTILSRFIPVCDLLAPKAFEEVCVRIRIYSTAHLSDS